MTTKTAFSDKEEGGQKGGVNANLPDERTEVHLKKTIIRFLKESVEFEGTPEKIQAKLLELTCGLYDIFLANQLKK